MSILYHSGIPELFTLECIKLLSFQCFALDMLAMCGPEMWFYEELFFYRVCFSRMVARNDPPLFLNVTVSVIDLVSASHPLVTAA